jgi:hypothetical protein
MLQIPKCDNQDDNQMSPLFPMRIAKETFPFVPSVPYHFKVCLLPQGPEGRGQGTKAPIGGLSVPSSVPSRPDRAKDMTLERKTK